MATVNPFDVFSITQIGAAIQRVPNTYGRLDELGLFPIQGVVGTSIAVEESNGKLGLIPSERLRGPGFVAGPRKRKLRDFRLIKLIEDEFCGPEEVQGLRMFGGESQQALASLLNQKLAAARANHDITQEHLRMGAVKGTILDADGSTLYDLYTEFGVTQKSVDFLLGTAGTDINEKCREVLNWIQDHLQGERMTGVRALVSGEFFGKLINHAKVEKFFLGYQNARNAQQLSNQGLSEFAFGGIVFEEYRGVSVTPSGTQIRFIEEDEGHAFPMGTVNTFRTFVGPADFNETVGTLGQLYYAKTMPAKFDRGWDIHTQSNVLPLAMRPEVLVRVYTSN